MIYLFYGKEKLLIEKEIKKIRTEYKFSDLDINEYY